MFEGTTVIGLDVHKRSITVAVRRPGSDSVEEERLPHESGAVARWARRWKRLSGGKLACAYEAGACGYALQRQLEGLGIDCQVVARAWCRVDRANGSRPTAGRRASSRSISPAIT